MRWRRRGMLGLTVLRACDEEKHEGAEAHDESRSFAGRSVG
jgi:hypothetical protein